MYAADRTTDAPAPPLPLDATRAWAQRRTAWETGGGIWVEGALSGSAASVDVSRLPAAAFVALAGRFGASTIYHRAVDCPGPLLARVSDRAAGSPLERRWLAGYSGAVVHAAEFRTGTTTLRHVELSAWWEQLITDALHCGVLDATEVTVAFADTEALAALYHVIVDHFGKRAARRRSS